MRHCTLNLSDITDKEALHARLAGSLMLPDYYGRNLDALKDCLTDIRENLEIIVTGYDRMEESLTHYARGFRQVLEDASSEDPHITVVFR